jgi:cysteine synthase
MIDLTVNEQVLTKNIAQTKKHGIIIPTFNQMRNPETIPASIKERLKNISGNDFDPACLFSITWKNNANENEFFDKPNYIILPSELTGCDTKIVCLVGSHFPTGSHKAGSAFGCLVPKLVTGQFDITTQKAVFPSTGNYCRGGAWISKLLSVHSISILPEGMSKERFDDLNNVSDEIITTVGTESNVKEIFDKVSELKATTNDVEIFNQFSDMGNYLWHYSVTGPAIDEVFTDLLKGNSDLNFAGGCFTSGSSGTLASGDYLKQQHPKSKLAVGEALQCPTILNNGFGSHRIEGIGDKHIPWIHNVKNTDLVIAIDDNDCMRLLRLFNEQAGKNFLINSVGLHQEQVEQLALMGISGIANMLCCIKFVKHYKLGANDVVATVLTDSIDMYKSRLVELQQHEGAYTDEKATADFSDCIIGQGTDNMLEMTERERLRVHNLKYYTWVEQQGKTTEQLNELWHEQEKNFLAVQKQADEIDKLIIQYNERTIKNGGN